MTDAEADYLLGAVAGLAQAARLVPIAELRDHLAARRREARARGEQNERMLAEQECHLAAAFGEFVTEAETLMDARRNVTLTKVEQAKAEAHEALGDLPPSRRPLADDDVWVTAPPRR
jgi:hypothetical protein